MGNLKENEEGTVTFKVDLETEARLRVLAKKTGHTKTVNGRAIGDVSSLFSVIGREKAVESEKQYKTLCESAVADERQTNLTIVKNALASGRLSKEELAKLIGK